jgi:hypothetical protein
MNGLYKKSIFFLNISIMMGAQYFWKINVMKRTCFRNESNISAVHYSATYMNIKLTIETKL